MNKFILLITAHVLIVLLLALFIPMPVLAAEDSSTRFDILHAVLGVGLSWLIPSEDLDSGERVNIDISPEKATASVARSSKEEKGVSSGGEKDSQKSISSPSSTIPTSSPGSRRSGGGSGGGGGRSGPVRGSRQHGIGHPGVARRQVR